MNWADYLILGLLVVSCLAGLMRGLLRELISLLTWVLAIVLSWRLADWLMPHLGGMLAAPNVRPWAARSIIFLCVLVVGTTVGAILNHYVRLSIFSGLDRFLGLVFGTARAIVAFGFLAMLCQQLKVNDDSWYRQSMLLPYAERVAVLLRSLTGDAGVGQLRTSADGRHTPQAFITLHGSTSSGVS
jgi:membrane protein required for colicin V production